jgi:hypothetical protein
VGNARDIAGKLKKKRNKKPKKGSLKRLGFVKVQFPAAIPAGCSPGLLHCRWVREAEDCIGCEAC